MEREQFYASILPLTLLYAWFIGVTILVPPGTYQDILQFVGLLVVFGGMWLGGVWMRDRLGKFTHLKANIDDGVRYRTAHLYVEAFESRPIGPNRYRTALYLGRPWRYKHYGSLDRIFVTHTGRIKERINANRNAWATASGFVFRHPHSDHVTLFEKPRPVVILGKLFPEFELAAAGGDRGLAPLAPVAARADGGQAGCGNCPVKAEAEHLKAEVSRLREENIMIRETQQALHDETRGLMHANVKRSKLIKEEFYSWNALFGDFDSAMRAIVGPKVPWNLVAVTAVALAAIGVLYARPEYVQWAYEWLSVPMNLAFLGVIAVVLLIIKWKRR